MQLSMEHKRRFRFRFWIGATFLDNSSSSRHIFFPTNHATDPENSTGNSIPSPNHRRVLDESDGKLSFNARNLHANTNCVVSNDTIELLSPVVPSNQISLFSPFMSVASDDGDDHNFLDHQTAKEAFDAHGDVHATVGVSYAAALSSTADLLTLTVTTGSAEDSYALPSLLRERDPEGI